MGSTATCTLSLKTTHRQTVVTTAKHLLTTLRMFHLDKPEATWAQLCERLKEIAEGVLASRSTWDKVGMSMGLGQVYSDIREDLSEIAATEPLNMEQAGAVQMGSQVMVAAEKRLYGDLEELLGLISRLKHTSDVPLSLSVSAPKELPERTTERTQQVTLAESLPPCTFEYLSGLYTAEREGDVQVSTMKNIKASCGVLSGLLGDLDMRTHTRADLIALRENLKEGRKVSTVNKILSHLSTVLGWAEANAYIDKRYDKKLPIQKGSESARKEFSPEQVVTLMTYANRLPDDSWQRWALSLAVVTGARIGEIHKLTSKDITKDAQGQLLMDINTNDGKTIKNSFSIRKVPIVSAYGLDLEALQAFAVQSEKAVSGVDGRLFKRSSSGFESMLNLLIRDVLGTETKTGLSFHSLRHHLAGSLKAAEVPVGTAQEILGHSSGTLAFDRYGAGRSVQMGRMAEALEKALVY
ncbi:tyrosine-type recombinase/integrase [Pseudomonas sp.]